MKSGFVADCVFGLGNGRFVALASALKHILSMHNAAMYKNLFINISLRKKQK
jgi:hypothetical protein